MMKLRHAIPPPMSTFSNSNKDKETLNPTAKMIKLATTDIYAARAL